MNTKRRTSLTQDSLFAVTREQELSSLRKPALRERRVSLPAGKLFTSRNEDVFFYRSPQDCRIHNPFKSNNSIYESIFQKIAMKEALSKGFDKSNQADMDAKAKKYEMPQKFLNLASSNRRRSLPSCHFFQSQNESPLPEAVSKYPTQSTRRTSLSTMPDLAHATGKQNSAQSKFSNTKSGPKHVSEKRPSLSMLHPMGISKSVSGFMERVGDGVKVNRSSKSEARLQDAVDDEDIDFLVSLYGRISVDSGYSDCYSELRRQSTEISELGLRPEIAEIETSFCHSKNVFKLSLGRTFLKPSRLETNRGVYVKFCFQPDKIQKQKSKVLPFDENMKWNIDVKFKHLTMHQLETGSIDMKIYVPSKYGFTKTCIARAQLKLKRHDYRSPMKINLILE